VVAWPVTESISVDGMKPRRVMTGPPRPPDRDTFDITLVLAT
jgi:hypothetical protein